MMNDLNIPFFRKTMFAGMATLFLSTGVTQANPVSAGVSFPRFPLQGTLRHCLCKRK